MLHFTARLADRGFDAHVEVAAGETLAILGPNGSGKSTLLECLAGLIRPDSGTARLDDRILFDLGPAASGTWLPPHRRAVSLLAQKALLFPRMSVRDNVAFGPRSTGAGTRSAREHADHWLSEVDATELADRRPAQVSGGEAQRIAIARALASQPKLLLLDEPLAALDVGVTPALRRLLRRVLVGQTAIIVTHDVLDAYTLASTVVVMDGGHVIERGETKDVLERPRTPFTAALVGLNLLTGVRTSRGLRLDSGLELGAVAASIAVGGRAGGTVSPSRVRISLDPPTGSGITALEGRVVDLEPHGDFIRVNTGQIAADITPALVSQLDLIPGMTVWSCFVESELQLYGL